MIESAEITIYASEDRCVSIDLSPTQVEAVFKLLGIKFVDNENVSMYSDESLRRIMEKTIDRLK